MNWLQGSSGVPITGYGCLCAAGPNATECAASIVAGTRNFSYDNGVTNARGSTFPVFSISERWLPQGYGELTESRHCGELALAAAREAMAHAGIDSSGLDDIGTVGICLGTTAGNSLNSDPFYANYLGGKFPDIQPILDYRATNPAAYVGAALGASGPFQTVTSACSSGTIAIGEAMHWIESGRCDMVIAGGAEKLCPVICHGFASLFIADSEPCRPFDANRRGLNLGEGAGIVILESHECLRRRRAKRLGSMVGYGNRCDAYHLSAPNPKGTGLQAALNDALDQCGLDMEKMAFICAHGTGTKDNDAMESKVFSKMAPNVPFFSLKGYTGHPLGAAGAIEAVLTLIFLNAGKIPASAGFESPSPDVPVSPTVKPTIVKGDHAVSDSIAYGGNCGALIIKRGDA